MNLQSLGRYVVCLNIIVICSLFASYANASKIHTIRASSYYSKAVSAYSSGNCSTTLKHLSEAEKNLKGKFNRDLEYLKIICLYKTKNYADAYESITRYFDNPKWKNNLQNFLNVETYDKKANIDYEESLTSVFIELEDWASTQKDISPYVQGVYFGREFIKTFDKSVDRLDRSLTDGVSSREYSIGKYSVSTECDNDYYRVKPVSPGSLNLGKTYDIAFMVGIECTIDVQNTSNRSWGSITDGDRFEVAMLGDIKFGNGFVKLELDSVIKESPRYFGSLDWVSSNVIPKAYKKGLSGLHGILKPLKTSFVSKRFNEKDRLAYNKSAKEFKKGLIKALQE